jgi:hypothetical protein
MIILPVLIFDGACLDLALAATKVEAVLENLLHSLCVIVSGIQSASPLELESVS